MEYNVKVWRQKNAKAKGHFETYHVTDVEEDASFLEMLDILNDQLIRKGIEPVAFDHDCREGICGACSLYVDGRAHGPDDAVTTCQLFMRHFKPGATITVEPWRSGAFPVIKDLVVDRTAFDKIMQAGGFITVRAGSAQDGNNILIPHDDAELSMDAAACVGSDLPKRHIAPRQHIKRPLLAQWRDERQTLLSQNHSLHDSAILP